MKIDSSFKFQIITYLLSIMYLVPKPDTKACISITVWGKMEQCHLIKNFRNQTQFHNAKFLSSGCYSILRTSNPGKGHVHFNSLIFHCIMVYWFTPHQPIFSKIILVKWHGGLYSAIHKLIPLFIKYSLSTLNIHQALLYW